VPEPGVPGRSIPERAVSTGQRAAGPGRTAGQLEPPAGQAHRFASRHRVSSYEYLSEAIYSIVIDYFE
jgi:hypothetical protein